MTGGHSPVMFAQYVLYSFAHALYTSSTLLIIHMLLGDKEIVSLLFCAVPLICFSRSCLVPRMPPKSLRSRGSRGRSRPYPSRSEGPCSSRRLGGTISPSPGSSLSPPKSVSTTNEQFLRMIREEVRQQLSW